MNIWVFQHQTLGFLQDYLIWNEIEFDALDTWDTELDSNGRHILPQGLMLAQKDILILYTPVFHDMMEWAPSRQRLIEFCQHNILWITCDGDGFEMTLDTRWRQNFENLDASVPPGHVLYIMDCTPIPDSWMRGLGSIEVVSFPYTTSVLQGTPRIYQTILEKNADSRDYFLTTINKKERPHRQILQKELVARPQLLDQGRVFFHASNSDLTDEWVGHKQKRHQWNACHPSMDLYRDHWVEIVPETLHQDAWYITEKIMKPIVTGTPFVVISTPGFLGYLRGLGFQTFGDIVDETYDNETDLVKRVRMALDTVEQIVRMGGRRFYESSRCILEHNRRMLYERSGAWSDDMDRLIYSCLTWSGFTYPVVKSSG